MSREQKRQKFYLPEDVIPDILSRLPGKALLRFKCVCTNWCSLISSPYFASMHLSHSNSNPLRQSILVHISDENRLHICNESRLVQFDAVSFSPYTHFNVGLDQTCSFGPYMRIVGSINGVLCVCGSSCRWVYLWNPLTRMLRKIKTRIIYCYSAGFGFDPIANDYKVVLVARFINKTGVARTGLAVWSANLESWRKIKVGSSFIPNSFICDVILKEFAYWIVKRGHVTLVASFNMSTERLELVPVPRVYPSNNHNYAYINGVIWKENFALATFDCSGIYQVWTMENDAAGKKNWSKKFTLRFGRSLQDSYKINIGNGKVLYNRVRRGTRELILYDMETRIRQIAETMQYDYPATGAHCYVESLISIKGFKPMPKNLSSVEDVAIGVEDEAIEFENEDLDE